MLTGEVGPKDPAARGPWFNAWVLGVLRTPGLRRLLNGTVAEISYPARRGHVSFPVGYTRDGDTVLVVVGRPEGKRWWRHFRRAAQPATIRVREGVRQGLGRAVRSGEPDWERAAALWRQRHPGREMPSDVAVLIELIAR